MNLSVVIPVYNAESYISNTVKQFVEIEGFDLQIVCVNDKSSDRSLEILEDLQKTHPQVEVINLKTNSGAGVARNIGFERVTGEFVYFFDADDTLQTDAFVKSLKLVKNTKAELIVCGYFLGETSEDKGPMHRLDSNTWNEILGPQSWTMMNSHNIPSLLATTNYPWTKILRTEYARRIKLRFGETIVHNDILGHWMSLLFAKRLVLSREAICTHIVPANGSNLTNIQDKRRLGVFEALSDLDDILAHDPRIRATSLFELTRFKVIVLKWARSNVGRAYQQDFDKLAQKAFENIEIKDYLGLQRKWPNVAKDMVSLRFGK